MDIEYYQQYKENKRHCGRHRIVLPKKKQTYIKEKVTQDWTPDVIIGRAKESIQCSVRTLYRQFKEKIFDEATLPMKWKRKPNRHQERRGKQAFKRNISEREKDYLHFKEEFGHIEGDQIVGIQNKSAIITLVEWFSKAIITLKLNGRKTSNIELAMNHFFQAIRCRQEK